MSRIREIVQQQSADIIWPLASDRFVAASFAERVARAVLEECCQAICGGCMTDNPRSASDTHWYHGGDPQDLCYAGFIRKHFGLK